jgi:hypothetical protein
MRTKSTLEAVVAEHIQHAGGDRAVGLKSFRNRFTRLAREKKWTLKDTGLLPLFEAMVDTSVIDISNATEVSEAMTAAGYPTIVSALIHPSILAPYQPIADEVLKLVEELPGKHQIEYLAGFGALDNLELVREGMPYEEAQPAERKAKCESFKFGKTISLTLEMVMFDQTGQVLSFASGIGEKAGLHLHKMIVQRATDQACTATGQAVNTSLNLAGTNCTVFSTDHSAIDGQTNPNLSTTTLTSDGLTTVRALFAALKDDKGEEMLLNPNLLLVRPELEVISAQIVYSAQEFDGGAAFNLNPHKGKYTILVSPFLDVATAWYIGEFSKQTKLVWIYKLKTWVLKDAAQISFSNDIVAQFKAGYYGGVALTDYRYVIAGKKS